MKILRWLCAASLVYAPVSANSDEPFSREDRIRSAVVYHLAKFVEWTDYTAPQFVICVVGEGTMSAALEETMLGKVIHSTPAVTQTLKEWTDITELTPCRMVIVLEKEKNPALLLKKRPIALVCLAEKPVWGTCMIFIFREGNRARIGIDQQWVEESGLKASSELLALSVLRPRASE